MIIYDCEIIKAIPTKNELKLGGIEYCGGWSDLENMSISVICAYDYSEERYRVFAADNFPEFQKLVHAADIVIGFNSLRFDNPLCRANGIDVDDTNSWDLLAEIWAAVGLAKQFAGSSHEGFSLDACSNANFGTAKTGHGALAPVDWQCGNIGSVIDYCIHDVKLTKALVDRVIVDGFLLDPRAPNHIIRLSGPSC